MALMGLDLSLTSTGVSCDGETFCISAPKDFRGAQRLSFISNKILDSIDLKSVACVIIEGYSYGSRSSQAHSIGELGGCVRMKLWENGISFVDVPPTVRAKFATGKGNAGKTEVISAISSKTGKTFSGGGADDECDAWVLEQMALTYLNLSPFSWTKEQISALSKVDWSPLSLTNYVGE